MLRYPGGCCHATARPSPARSAARPLAADAFRRPLRPRPAGSIRPAIIRKGRWPPASPPPSQRPISPPLFHWARCSPRCAWGEPNLPDPGPRALAVEKGERCCCSIRTIRHAPLPPLPLLPAARAEAAARGLPLLLVRSPEAPPAAAPVLPDPPEGRRIAARLSPWTLIDAAAVLFAAGEETGLLALAAGVPVVGRLPGGADPGTALAALFARTRWSCPFTGRPLPPEEGLHLLALWRLTEAQNRRVAITLGMALWKRPTIAALFAHGGGRPPSTRFAGDAIARAKKTGGAIAVWASRAPAGFAEYCAERGIPVLWVEDGFIRSAGLGAGYMPAASYTLDPAGPYYDPAIRSGLITLLEEARFDPALLARARRLRERIVAAGVSKYNLGGAAPALPPAAQGRKRILVPGQVADDLSVLRGGGRIRSNLELLEAVRAENPDAFLIYKPHPDVVAGHRKGAVPRATLARLADAVLPAADITALIAAADEVHTLTSLAGFEALLRGKRVVTWGRPFYAGWGLTEDRDPPRAAVCPVAWMILSRRCSSSRRATSIRSRVCPDAEVLLDRLADRSAWRPSPIAPLRAAQGAVRRWLARLAGRV